MNDGKAEDNLFDPSTILDMDESFFQDHEDDYSDDESVDLVEEAIEDDESQTDKFAPIILSMRPMIHYDVGYELMNADFLGELVRKGLFGFKCDIGSPAEISAAIDQLFDAKFFLSKHENQRRSLSISTYGSHIIRTMKIMLNIPIFSKFFGSIEKIFNGIITKTWAFYFIEGGGGKFVFHRDQFNSKFRLILTLGDSKRGKLMRFVNRKTGQTVALKIPSGTVIGMSRVVAGADRERGGMYYHEVRNCEGTFSFGFQVNQPKRANKTSDKSGRWPGY